MKAIKKEEEKISQNSQIKSHDGKWWLVDMYGYGIEIESDDALKAGREK